MNDDRPVYSDVGEFTRGRAGIRPETHDDPQWWVVTQGIFAWFVIPAVFWMIVGFAIARALMPSVR